MDEPDRIHLRDHTVTADIGAFETERGQPQRLRFGVEVALAAPVAGAADEVDRILSYDVLTGAVAAALAERRYQLLETLAEQIAAQVLTHPQAAEVRVTVEKLDRVPGALGVTLTRRRPRVAAAAAAAAARPLVIVAQGPFALPPGAVLIVPDAPRLPLPQGGDQRRIALLALDQAAWALAGALSAEAAGQGRISADHGQTGAGQPGAGPVETPAARGHSPAGNGPRIAAERQRPGGPGDLSAAQGARPAAHVQPPASDRHPPAGQGQPSAPGDAAEAPGQHPAAPGHPSAVTVEPPQAAPRAPSGPVVTVAGSRAELDWAVAEGLPVVWAPARMAADLPDLPADPGALALWLAERMGAARLDWALPADAPLPVPPAGSAILMGRADPPAGAAR